MISVWISSIGKIPGKILLRFLVNMDLKNVMETKSTRVVSNMNEMMPKEWTFFIVLLKIT